MSETRPQRLKAPFISGRCNIMSGRRNIISGRRNTLLRESALDHPNHLITREETDYEKLGNEKLGIGKLLVRVGVFDRRRGHLGRSFGGRR